ncbi:MAG: hypothetical protein EKK53_24265 [Burkholderiales bacterium]|jgi:hypothetical protein|nr:MAG: hypothetical protein EKK53_24265 [Burkholderiales bacterium]
MAAVFRQVFGLWIAPDFSGVQQGLIAPPYVNHDEVNYETLLLTLNDFFSCPERVRLRIPNDTIDQVTIHFRIAGADPTTAQCSDFAELLLKATPGSRSTIPVRQHWQSLHYLKDRKHAPPPALLMFVVEGTFEAVMIWFGQAWLRLGIRAGDMTVMLDPNGPKDSDYEGRLPLVLRSAFEEAFGVPYVEPCQLTKLASSAPPAWVVEAAAAWQR